MPDQVRHDWQELIAFLNYDTVWQVGIQKHFAEKAGYPLESVPAKAGEVMTGKLSDPSLKLSIGHSQVLCKNPSGKPA